MLKARLTKAIVAYDNKMRTTLLAVVEYEDECLNVNVPYDWTVLDQDGFILDLKDQIAKDFDIGVANVDIPETKLLQKMELFNLKNTGLLN